MTTPYTDKIDMPLVLWRINPAMEYHWKASGWGTYADIGEWRSPDIPKPTEAAVYAEWDVYLIEQGQVAETTNALDQSIEGASVEDLTPKQVKAVVALLLSKVNGLTIEGKIKSFQQWE